jgi:two-component system, repressor protein LuxO
MDSYIGGSQATALAGKNKVLLVEDTPSLLTIYSSYIQNAGFEVVGVDSGKKCLSLLAAQLPGVVVLDLGLPDMTGLEILRHIRDHNLSTTVVVITNNASLATAVEAMRLGAFDYVVKPFSAERLAATVKNAHERQSLKTEVQVYRSTIARDEFRGFIGSSLPMQAVYRIIESAATSMATVFICGESGTGKDVCASGRQPCQGAFCRTQLCRYTARSHRVGNIRPRQRSVHRSDRGQARGGCASTYRNPVSR